jgi:polyphenol oxidase
VSPPPFDTANLSTAVADDPMAVAENRNRLAQALQLPVPTSWWWVRQVHGAGVVVADGPPPREAPPADGIITRVDVPVVVLTADCAPVLLVCDDALGVVHAGWKGLLAGVIEAAVAQLRDVGTGDVRAVLGPCIHPERYEFGAADLAPLVERFGSHVESRRPGGSLAFDLPAGVRVALARAGVSDFHDHDVCTAASPDYFSNRRDGETGRQALVAVLAG